jgi:Peptidase A4 family
MQQDIESCPWLLLLAVELRGLHSARAVLQVRDEKRRDGMKRTKLVPALLCTGVMAIFIALPATGTANAASSKVARPSRAAVKALVLQDLRSGKIGGPIRGVKILTSHARAAGDNLSRVGSSNWSGYAVDHSEGNTYTSVSATWKVPAQDKPCGTSSITITSFWVGLDGFGNSTVEQDGSSNVCDDGSEYDYDWYELYPAGTVGVNDVDSGNSISASVNESRGKYTLVVTDSSDPADSFATKQSCKPSKCRDQTAEWIGESPCCVDTTSGFYDLTPYKTWAVTDAAVNGGTISSYPDDEITQYSEVGSYNLEKPGALGAAGNKFTDKFLHSF